MKTYKNLDKPQLLTEIRKRGGKVSNRIATWKASRWLVDFDEIYEGSRQLGYIGDEDIGKIKRLIREQARTAGFDVKNFSNNEYIKVISYLWKNINKWEISFKDVPNLMLLVKFYV